MRRSLLTFLVLLLSTFAFSQTQLFYEDFEGSTLQMTSTSTGTGVWALNTRLYAQGAKSDSAVVTTGDTTYLTTTNSFSTTGKSAVYLSFSHIAKVSFFDGCEIQVSTDGGTTWTKLTATEYQGTGQFQNGRFSAVSYVDWQAATPAAVPQNSWWKHEEFDISALAGNKAAVKVRFALIDGDNNGAQQHAGWFLDSIEVVGSFSELVPPVVNLVPPVVKDTVYTTGPYDIYAHITDNSGIDTAVLMYYTSDGYSDTLGMTIVSTDTFKASIPFYGYGRTITYYVKAVDSSPAANTDSVSQSFFCKYSAGGTYQIGTGTNTNSSTNYPTPFGQWYTGSKEQYVILASELQAMGASGGAINSIAFDVVTPNSATSSGSNHDNYTIKMKNTTTSSLSGTFETGMTQVYTVASYQTVSGWNTFTFQTPFVWDGTSNIIVETCFDNGSSNYSNNAVVNRTSTSFSSTMNTHSDASSNTCLATSGSSYNVRPNMKIVLVGATTMTNDIGVNQIVSPTGGVIAGQPMPLGVTIKNFGVDTITSAKVLYSYDGNISSKIYNYTDSLKADSVSPALYLDTITPALGAHNIKVWTKDPNNNADFNFANDTMSIDFYACSNLLNGSYTINPNGSGANNFASFSDAVLALSQCGISGPVTFNVSDGTYMEQIVIPPVNGASAANTITFQGVNNDSSLVTLKYDASNIADNYVVKIDGASYITFKSIGFEAMDSTFARVFDLTAHAHDITIKNSLIQSTVRSFAADDDMTLICGVDTVGNNIQLLYNTILRGSNAISLLGDNSTDVKVMGNVILDHFSKGVHLNNTVSPQILSNIIHQDTAFSASVYYGIFLEDCDSNIMVKYNKVLSRVSPIAFGIRMNACIASAGNRSELVNNFFQVHGNAQGGSSTTGILLVESKNIDVFYNNVYVYGNHANSAAFYVYKAASDSVVAVNNIFVNRAGGVAFRAAAVTIAKFSNDYNDLFVGNSTNLANINGTLCPTLSDFQTATGEGAHSVSIDPYFVSAYDLHIVNNAMNGLGTPIAGITTDIDGDVRNTTTPDMGADEFDPSPWDASMIAILGPTGGCGLGSSEQITVKLKNLGSATISGNLTVNYTWVGKTSPVTENITTTMNPGDTLIYTFSTTADFDMSSYGQDSTFKVSAWVDLLNDPVHNNDTVYTKIKSGYTPAPPTASNVTVSYGTYATLTATSTDTIIWYDSDTTTEIGMGSSIVVGMMKDTTTYWVSAVGPAAIVKLTETVQYKTGSGYTNPYPSYLPSGDFDGVEITNLGTGDADVSGYEINVYFGSTLYHYVFPAGTIIPQDSVLLAIYGYGLTVGPQGNNVFVINGSTGISSSTLVAYWLKDADGNVVDAFASNGATFPANSGVTAADFSGSLMGGGGKAGAVRVIADNNVASDWQLAGVATTSFGTKNSQLGTLFGRGCSSAKVPVTVYVNNFPQVDAGVASIVNPSGSVVSGSSPIVKVKLTNYGVGTMTSANIKWWINGQMQDSVAWTGSLTNGASDTITLDTIQNISGGMYNITAWTSYPNNALDTNTWNDTASINFNACMQGVYTIGDTASGNFDFPTFTSAINAMISAGICGNVVFNVDTGTYYEQVVINQNLPTGPNATVTFQSANGDSSGVILKYAPMSSGSNYTVLLHNAEYITFKNITITTAGTTNYTGLVQIDGTSSNINFVNNELYSVGTSSYARGIYVPYGSQVHHVEVHNNYLHDLYYAVYLRGQSSTVRAAGYKVKNNIIQNTRYCVYMYYTDSAEVQYNTMFDDTVVAYGYGVYMYYAGNGPKVTNNVMRFTPATYRYGIYMGYMQGTVSNRALVANNMISITSGTSYNYGLYVNRPQYADIYYNSVNITSGSTTSKALYLYYVVANSDVNVANNNIYDTVGYALYATGSASINTLDYNNYYSDGTRLAYWNGDKVDLAALQAASGKDANSVSVKPQFMSPTDLHMASTQLSAKGTPVGAVTVDIDGEQRDANHPTIGADEVALLPIDVGVSQILNFPDTTNEGQTYPVVVEVTNYGTDTIQQFGINYTVNNGTPVTYTYNQPFAPTQVDTVTLNSVVSPAGNATICATTVLSTDSNTFNDQVCQSFYAVPVKDAKVIEVKEIESYCGITYDTVRILITNLGQDTMNSSTQTVPTLVAFKATNQSLVTENFTQPLAPGDTTWYTFTNLVYLGTNNTVDSTYDIAAWVKWPGDNVAYNDSGFTSVDVLHVPVPPTVVTPVNIPYGTKATLIASSTDKLLWYATDTGSTIADTGSVYVTNYLIANDTMWVESQGGGTGGNVSIGNGTSLNQHLPMEMFYGYTYSQSIFYPADMNNQGGKVTKVSYYYDGSGAYSDAIKIYMGNTTQNSFSSNTSWIPLSDLQMVYDGQFVTTGSPGWIEITLDQPFEYDGSSNLVIAFDENTPGYHSSSDDFRCTMVSSNRSIYYYNDAINPDPASPPSSGYGMGTNSYIPNVQLELVPSGCPSPRSQVVVIVGPQPANDVGVVAVLDPDSGSYKSAAEDVVVRVINFGSSAQTNVPVKYTVNNSAVFVDTLASIPANDTVDFTFSQTVDMSAVGTNFDFVSWTDLSGDATALNDTSWKSAMHEYPDYCISTASSAYNSEIVNVNIAMFNNASPATGAKYTNFMSSVSPINLQIGVANNVNITTSYSPGSSYNSSGYMKIFIDYNRDGDFDDQGEEVFGGASQSNGTVTGNFTIPVGVGSGLSAMRIVHKIYGSQSNTNPCGVYGYGETEDYMVYIVPRIPHDAGVEAFIEPATLAASSVVPVKVTVRNYGTDTINSVDINLVVNNGTPTTTTYTTQILPMASAMVNLGNVTLQDGKNTLCAYTVLAGDSNTINDQTCKDVFREAVVNLSYFDDFESQDLWMPDTIVNQWQRGVPAMTHINTAHSPVNVWGIDLDSNYMNGSGDYLYSPRIVTTGLDSAELKFWHYYVTESGDDGGQVQVSVNNGTWFALGYLNDPAGTNWYNTNVGGTHAWTGNSNGWVQSVYPLKFTDPGSPVYGADTIQFRFYFFSDNNTNNYDGWAIDDFSVSLPKIANDAGVIGFLTPGDSTQINSSQTVSVVVKNFGYNALTSIPVHYKVGTTVENATITIPTPGLLPDSTTTYTFSTPYTVPSADYRLCAYTTLAGDLYVQNDSTCKNITVTAPPVDIEMVSVVANPTRNNGGDTTMMTYNTHVTITMVSKGTAAITSIPVEYEINGNGISSETWTGTANQGDTITYTFNKTYKGRLGVYQLCGIAKAVGDAVANNNKSCKNYIGINDVGMDETTGLTFAVDQNQPNPAHGVVNINYVLPKSGKLHFELRNVLGQVISSEELDMPAGANVYQLDANKLSGGVYYYTFEFDGVRITKKMIVNN